MIPLCDLRVCATFLLLLLLLDVNEAFSPTALIRNGRLPLRVPSLDAAKGFGASSGGGFSPQSSPSSEKKKTKESKKSNRLINILADQPKERPVDATSSLTAKPYVKSEQDALLEKLAAKASYTCIGQAVDASPVPREEMDPFWGLMPSLINSKFPNVPDSKFQRIAGMIRHTLDRNLPLEESIINDPWRPHQEIHAYMPGLGGTKPFHDTSNLALCRKLNENYEVIKAEYEALVNDKKDRFQSVTSMNYESGWKTLVLFYNGHRIKDFPYHLCPTTTKILESVPLAGRIAGFNRQQPNSGIPLHSDGNNMWLTCQMGVLVPEGKSWK
jgi:hypothetical protein